MASNYQPIFANGERVGSSMTIDPSKLGKGSIIFAPNGSAPRVMQQDDFFHKIPDKGPLVRPCGKCLATPEVDGAFKSCSRCKSTAYCSVECQKAHWKEHKPICSSRVEGMEQIRRAEAEAEQAGKPFFNQLLLQKWYRDEMSSIVEYAAFHVLEVYKGPRQSLSRTHIAFFDVRFDDERPKDVHAIKLDDVAAVPLSILGRLGPAGQFSMFERMATTQGGMVILLCDTDKSVVHIEGHVPESAEPYLRGEKRPDERWKMHVLMQANSGRDKIDAAFAHSKPAAPPPTSAIIMKD